MTKINKQNSESVNQTNCVEIAHKTVPSPNDIEWTDYVLKSLSDDEKINGNPTTDGLRRIFETVLNCTIIESLSQVVQSPTPDNEKRATVVHSMTFILNNDDLNQSFKTKKVSGAADVYWGNCDKIYRNHPVAVAETRAEGRCLRRALKLRKVVAAEEISQSIEDDPDAMNITKISEQQINFIDVMAKRNNINIKKLLLDLSINETNIKHIEHDTAVGIIRELSKYQQNLDSIPSNLIGYENEWR